MKKIILMTTVFAAFLFSCACSLASAENETQSSTAARNELSIAQQEEISHTHILASEEQTENELVGGYCGNTKTTIHFPNGKKCTFMYEKSVELTDLLFRAAYDKDSVCLCAYEYIIDTDLGTGYYVNLTEGFVRNEEGQVSLTEGQVETIKNIIDWALADSADSLIVWSDDTSNDFLYNEN